MASSEQGDDDRDESQAGGSDANWAEDPGSPLCRPLDLLDTPKHAPNIVERRLHIGEPCVGVRYVFRTRNSHLANPSQALDNGVSV